VPHEDNEQDGRIFGNQLSRPPVYVFIEAIKGDKNMTEYYPGRLGWFPVLPIREEIATPSEFNAQGKTFVRTQIPLSPRFVASNYRVQGRSMQKIILDLPPRPPTGRLDLQNRYIMLSARTELAIGRVNPTPRSDSDRDFPYRVEFGLEDLVLRPGSDRTRS
jgi:hypothetical protein